LSWLTIGAYAAISKLLSRPDTSSRMPGLARHVRLPSLHPPRRPPPPKKPRLPTKEAPRAERGSEDDEDEDEAQNAPDIDYENEGFL